MNTNSESNTTRELHQRISALSKLLVKSFTYADEDPDSFLLNARKTTETILKFIYNREVEDETGKKMMLNDYARVLLNKKVIPERMGLLIGTIQTYGNYGAHAQEDFSEASKEWIAPCQTALANLSNWFFLDYLKGEVPGELVAPLKDYSDSEPIKNSANTSTFKRKLVPVLLGFIAVVIVLVFIVFTGGNNTTTEDNSADETIENTEITSVGIARSAEYSENTIVEKSPDAKRLAILYFDNSGEDKKLNGLAKGLADMMITDLSKYYMLQVVERGRLEDIIKEQDMSRTGKFDAATASKIGKLLGAEIILTGSYFELIGNLRIDARIIDVETGAVLKSEGVNGTSDSFFELEKQLVSQLLKGMEVELKEEEKHYLKNSSTGQFPLQAGLKYSKALELMDEGNREEALQAFTKFLEQNPGFEPAENAISQLEI